MTLLAEDFNLEYGEKVHIRIKGSDGEVYQATTDDMKTNVLTPYVSDELVFGYYKDQYFPLDYENQAYPAKGQISELNLTEDVQVSRIKLCERMTESEHKRLHGIQLFFSDGS